jgi:hypothetical protein
MPKAQKISGVEPLPRYSMPDESEPEYTLILNELQDDRRSIIGMSYYYIKSDPEGFALCRIIHGGGKVYFHEIVDHRKSGISDEDIELSAEMDPGTFELPGYFHISALVEQKLRALNGT